MSHAQLGGRSTPQGMNLGAFQPPGPEDPAARPQPRYQKEEARKAGSASRLRSSGDNLLEDSREEEEVQAIDHANGESGGADALAFIDGREKDAPRREVQEEADPAGKESASKGTGRRHSGRSSSGRSGPPERRAGLEPGANVYRGPAGSRPRIVHVEGGESAGGSNNKGTSPRRRPAAYRPHGKATKRPSPQADPVTAPEEEIGLGGPSGSGEKEASQSKPPSLPKTRPCPTCGKLCRSLKVLNKHRKEVHMGNRFKCRYCPRKYKTRSNRKKHADRSCTSSRAPAGAARRAYTPAP